MAEERLQKAMARAGVGSRRTCEDMIQAGRVHVNGKVAELGQKVDPHKDKITVDYEPLAAPEPLVYVALYKPKGVISSLREQGGVTTVRELVPLPQRIYPVGRLDIESEGLMIMTNDGALTDVITHPRYGSEKEYDVKVTGHPRDEQLDIWRRGLVLPDTGEQTQPARVSVTKEGASGTWLKVIMQEGKNNQIRRVAETLGMHVKQLIRVRMGSLRVGRLQPGEWRELKPAEVKALRQKPGSQRRRTFNRGEGRPQRGGARPAGLRQVGAISRPTREGGARPTGSRPADSDSRPSRPSGSRPTGSRPTDSDSRSSRPSGSRPTGSRPTGSASGPSRPSGSRPTGSRPTGSSPGPSRPSGSRPTGSRPTGSTPRPSRPSGSRPTGSRPSGPSGSRPSGPRPSGGNRTPARRNKPSQS